MGQEYKQGVLKYPQPRPAEARERAQRMRGRHGSPHAGVAEGNVTHARVPARQTVPQGRALPRSLAKLSPSVALPEPLSGCVSFFEVALSQSVATNRDHAPMQTPPCFAAGHRHADPTPAVNMLRTLQN